MKCDIFYKKRYQELSKAFIDLKNLAEDDRSSLKQTYTETMARDRKWIQELLAEKNQLEKDLERIQEKNKKLEKINAENNELKIQSQIDKEEYQKIIKELQESLLKRKESLRIVKATLGGTTKANHELNKKNGAMQLKLDYLNNLLKKYRIQAPTIEELREYERTHKTPKKYKQ